VEQMRTIKNIKKEFAKDIPLVVIGITPTIDKMLIKHPNLNEVISSFNQALKDIFQENDFFVDMEDSFKKYGDLLLHLDGHHLSKYGHRIVFENLASILKNKLAL
jgi:lysophospholipase L1-like esterase